MPHASAVEGARRLGSPELFFPMRNLTHKRSWTNMNRNTLLPSKQKKRCSCGWCEEEGQKHFCWVKAVLVGSIILYFAGALVVIGVTIGTRII